MHESGEDFLEEMISELDSKGWVGPAVRKGISVEEAAWSNVLWMESFGFFAHPHALFLFLDKTLWGIPSPVCGTVLVELPVSWNLSLRQLNQPRAVELFCPKIWFFSPIIAKTENGCYRTLKILFIATEWVPMLWFSAFLSGSIAFPFRSMNYLTFFQ